MRANGFGDAKTDIIPDMRFVAAIALLPVAAFAVTVEPLPPSEYADTEVSTNIVEVAIGTDANSVGNLVR